MSDAILAGLDPEQRAVAECLNGPVVVLAGAGSGKTRAITHRIAYGVATGQHDPRRSLAVTFTTRAAGEMRGRLRQLGVADAKDVQVQTFHAAALRQLRHFWPRINGGPFRELLPSKARLVSEAAKRCGLTVNGAQLRDLTSDVEWAKVSNLSGPRLREVATAVHRQLAVDADQLTLVQAQYEQLKEDRYLYDFEDILRVMAGALQEYPDMADVVRTRYRWFTVDEYQDVNPLQQRLLRLWLGERDDVCVVGDANQTIYSFTGASPTYLTTFRDQFPDATEVRLERCYRCTPQIVAMANAVIAGTPTAASSLVLSSQREVGPAPTVDSYADDVEEASEVVSRVRAHLAAGRSARDIAVLFRINSQSEALEEAFAEAGIPVVLRGTERFFDRPEIREGLTRLRGAARGGTAAGVVGGLGDEVRAVLSSMGWSPEAPRSAGAVRERWESLTALVSLADDQADALDQSLSAFVAELDARAEAQHAPLADGVTLATIHAAKGLEWPVVFVVGCSDGLLPLLYAESADQIEEERRLLYVAITRAADALHLSWAAARQPGGRRSREPSRFLADALGTAHGSASGGAGVVRRGSGRTRSERKQKGPARCRVCRKGLVTAQERTLGRCQSCPSDLNAELLDALREWRLQVSREKAVPAYVVFTDVTLIAIAELSPADAGALAEIPGIGPMKLQAYGEDVLALVHSHS